MTQYINYLKLNEKTLIPKLEFLLAKHKVQPVGSGYIDCIVMRPNLEMFIKDITDLGILITNASWWCYVSSSDNGANECPHGLGGPVAEHYEGWFSELQNKDFSVEDEKINSILASYDKDLIYITNMQSLEGINTMLKTPFKYTPTDFIEGNKCVMPGLWLLVPDEW